MRRTLATLSVVLLMSTTAFAQQIKVPDLSANGWEVAGAGQVEVRMSITEGRAWATVLSIFPMSVRYTGPNDTWAVVVSWINGNGQGDLLFMWFGHGDQGSYALRVDDSWYVAKQAEPQAMRFFPLFDDHDNPVGVRLELDTHDGLKTRLIHFD